MQDSDSYIMIGIGGLFLLIAFAFFFWARSEERSISLSLSRRRDLREFLTGWPMRVEPKALQVGGWISLLVGIVLIILGGILLI